jgi:hypothetical protein
MKINFKKMMTNSDQLDHFAPDPKKRWEWLMDELQSRSEYNRVIEIFGHRYIVGIEGKL